MTCPTCDGYEFVRGEDGTLESCPDCRAKCVPFTLNRCRAHGRRLVDGRCPVCRREARLAEDLIVRARAARESGAVRA